MASPRRLVLFKLFQKCEPFDDEALLVVFAIRDQSVKVRRKCCPRNLLLRLTMPIHQ
jgi:hypothetical protein